MNGSVGLRNWLYLGLLGFIWGTSFLAVSVALREYGPLTIAAIRIGIGAVLLGAVAIITGVGVPGWRTKTDRRVWLHCLGFALFTNAVPFALISWGQLRVPSGFAGIAMAVVPLFVLPLAYFVLKERMSWRKIFGFFLGFAGVVILIGPQSTFAGGDPDLILAKLACVTASLCYATGSMITRTAPETPLVGFSAVGLFIGTLLIVPAALWVEGVPQMSFRALPTGALLYLGIFPTALATVLLVRVIKSAGPTFLSLVNYQVPIWAVVNGMIVLDENLPASFATALVLILAGLAISQARGWRFRP